MIRAEFKYLDELEAFFVGVKLLKIGLKSVEAQKANEASCSSCGGIGPGKGERRTGSIFTNIPRRVAD